MFSVCCGRRRSAMSGTSKLSLGLLGCVMGLLCLVTYSCWMQSPFSWRPLPAEASCSNCRKAATMQPDGEEGEVFDKLLPGEERQRDTPGLVYSVVHYLWCGDKKFRFKDYLGVLSAVKIFRPFRLVFHFTHQPQTDDYNSWFKNVKSSIPGLDMQQLSSGGSCGSLEMLKTVLGFLSTNGGIFIGEGVVLSPALKGQPFNTDLWFAFSNTADKTSGVIVAKKGFSEQQQEAYFRQIQADSGAQAGCPSADKFTFPPHDQFCVTVPGTVFPRDIMYAKTSFAQVARLYFYGRSGPMVPEQDPDNLIPRIAHVVRFKSQIVNYKKEFPFCHYLTVLSALYVAGFHRVYIHTNEEPTGKWWQELAKENVTLVKMEPPPGVFQQPIHVLQHHGDIARYQILYKYGGAYQDCDVVWTSHVSDSLLSNPIVIGMDWARVDQEFPEIFNLGVMLARPGAQWLHYYLQTHREYRDHAWAYNSLQLSYRTYELHPHLMLLDRKLMVLCFNDICHPSWEKNYLRGIGDRRATMPFKWQEVRSLHITSPKPPASMASPEAVKQGKDVYAEIARFVLQKSGRSNLLS